MSLAELFSIIAVIISFIAVCISFLTFIDNKRQTKIMQKQLDEQLKPKFTDEPYNAYTAKLDRISRNLNDISNEIHKLYDSFFVTCSTMFTLHYPSPTFLYYLRRLYFFTICAIIISEGGDYNDNNICTFLRLKN